MRYNELGRVQRRFTFSDSTSRVLPFLKTVTKRKRVVGEGAGGGGGKMAGVALLAVSTLLASFFVVRWAKNWKVPKLSLKKKTAKHQWKD